MFFFDQASRLEAIPKALESAPVERARIDIEVFLRLPEKERLQTDVPPVWKRPLQQGVVAALKKISHGKCAFCEHKTKDLQAYRFRPPAYATPSKGPEDRWCYLWLTFNWGNLFPICSACLPTDRSRFPVTGRRARLDFEKLSRLSEELLQQTESAEKPVLYFPGELDHPRRAFTITPDGTLQGHNNRARQTIEHFQLNRNELLEKRRSAIEAQIEALHSTTRFTNAEPVSVLPNHEFAGSLFALLDQITGFLSESLGRRRPRTLDDILSRLEIWRWEPGFKEQLERALGRFDTEGRLEAMEASSGAEPAPTVTIQSETAAAATTPEIRPVPPKATTIQYPRLTSVELTNCKSLEKIKLTLPEKISETNRQRLAAHGKGEIPEAGCLLILGENATGKSSILEAIALACLPPAARDAVIEPRKFTLNPAYMGSEESKPRRHAEVRLGFDNKQILRLQVDAEAGFAGPYDGEDKPVEDLPLVFAYGAHRLYGGEQPEGADSHVATLFANDRQIPNPEPWLAQLEKDQPRALDEVVAALRHIIQIDGEFQNIETQADPVDGKHCFINIKRQKPDGSPYLIRQRLDIVSSGYRAVLALVCDVFAGLLKASDNNPREARRARAIVLIDEIEAHLHPRWKMQIMAGLRRALPRATFIVTSHDPLCLRGMMNDEVIMLNRYQSAGGESELLEAVERVDTFGNIESFTVEQLLTSDLFQLFSTDDQRTEQDFARAAEILTSGRKEKDFDNDERAILNRLRDEIAGALPFGRSEVTRLVQKAVAEYLAARRTQNASRTNVARKNAEKQVREMLKGMIE